MSAINLAGPRATVAAKVLIDECQITFDAQGAGDDAYTPIGMAVTQPAGDATLVYEGPCALLPATVRQGGPEGAAVPDTGTRGYRLLLPVDAPPVPTGSVATITAAVWDPNLLGTKVAVVEEILSTMLVVRELACERPR